jgi:hypothetical protein
MLYGWSVEAKHPRFRIASSVPGHCFRRHTVFQRAVPKKARFFDILLGPLGTMVASWSQENKVGTFLAGGPIGGKLRRLGKVGPPRPGLTLTAPLRFSGGDRLLWTWLEKKHLAGNGGRYRETVWGATGRPRGGRPGKARRLAQLVGHTELGYVDTDETLADMKYLADDRGGQVAGGLSRGGFRLMARRPGHAFGRARVFPYGELTSSTVKAAGNGRGDAVFAWESDYKHINALVRRRNGKLVGPTQIPRAGDPKYAGYPSVGIDGAGRAIVVYVAQGSELSQLVPNQIRVATSGRRGGFGAATSITGPPQTINEFPEVVVNARGQAAVRVERYFELPDGNLDYHYLMERGRLRR